MGVNYPSGCDTPGKRIAWCERAEELLRLVHEGMKKWWKLGLTQVQYDKFPVRVKNKYPYVAQSTEATFRDYQRTLHHDWTAKIMHARNIEWNNAKQDTTYNPDLEEDIS